MEPNSQRDYGPEHTLTWALLLLQAMHKAGLAECDNRRFHRLMFFGNSLARLYQFQPPAEIVMRLPVGPFYPQAQTDLDRLCVMGLAQVRDYRFERHGGAVERRGCYDISSSGFHVAARIRSGSNWAEMAGQLLFDLCMAYVSVGGDFKAEAADFNYQRASTETEPVFNFRSVHQNLSLQVTNQLRDSRPEGFRPISQHSLRVYLRYLERLAA